MISNIVINYNIISYFNIQSLVIDSLSIIKDGVI